MTLDTENSPTLNGFIAAVLGSRWRTLLYLSRDRRNCGGLARGRGRDSVESRVFRLHFVFRESQTSLSSPADQNIAAPGASPTLRNIFDVFWVVGITSFGGGLAAWIHREAVEKRHWLSEEDFLAGLALARAMPGINVINLSIWIGYRLRGGPGALTAIAGVFSAPIVLIFLLAMAYQHWGNSAFLHQALLGITAAALGMTFQMGLKALRPIRTHPFYLIVMLMIFVAVGVLHWSMLPVVGVLAPASVAWAFFMDKPSER
jgi:chromate transporter